jgi:hypothetical protein
MKENYHDSYASVRVFPDMLTRPGEGGKNSIRIRKTNGQEFIFSLREPKAWKFETIDQFLADMKGEKKHG